MRNIAGGHKYFINIYPGSISSRQVSAAPRKISANWSINIELRVAFNKEISEIHDNIITIRQTLVDHLDKYPTLNGAQGVTDTMVSSASEPEIWRGESSNYWIQRFNYVVGELSQAIIAE